jgi:hypothetical protein
VLQAVSLRVIMAPTSRWALVQVLAMPRSFSPSYNGTLAPLMSGVGQSFLGRDLECSRMPSCTLTSALP